MKIYYYKGKSNICGTNLKRIRKEQKLTQQQLAAKLQLEEINLDKDCISRIEIGTRFVADYELYILAKVLGVGMEDLIEVPDPQYN